MTKLIFVLLSLLFFYGCSGQTTSFLGSGATIASGGNVVKSLLTTGTDIYVKKVTGKSAFQHVAENTIEAEMRNCEINHSAEINKIFFVTLDQFDCKIK
tara:strand:+ start:513 stop:809 length:297 start_codon:yes stop_codon:yes gene_type:complete